MAVLCQHKSPSAVCPCQLKLCCCQHGQAGLWQAGSALCSLICLLREQGQLLRRGHKHTFGVCAHSSPARAGAVGGLFLHISGFAFTEEEKDDGLTMSVVSGEGMKSPHNGDRVEAQAAQADRPPKPGESGRTDTFFRRDTVSVCGCWGWR